MIHHYTCQVCGYDRAVWKISLSVSPLSFCENCFYRYFPKSRNNVHIEDFNLNRQNRRKIHAR